MDGVALDATRGLPPVCFYHSANYLTVNRNRDNPEIRTLTSLFSSDLTSMTVMQCIDFCAYYDKTYAGLENGSDCCECTYRRCLQAVLLLHVRDFIILITRYGCQIVEIP